MLPNNELKPATPPMEQLATCMKTWQDEAEKCLYSNAPQHLQKVVPLCNQIITLHSEYACASHATLSRAYTMCAHALFKEKKLDGAEDALIEALTFQENNPYAIQLLEEMYGNNADKKQEILNKASQEQNEIITDGYSDILKFYNPTLPSEKIAEILTITKQALSALRSNNFKEADKLLDGAKKQYEYKLDPIALNLKCKASYGINNYSVAIQCAKLALEKAKDFVHFNHSENKIIASSYFYLGMSYYRNNDEQSARKSLINAMEFDTSYNALSTQRKREAATMLHRCLLKPLQNTSVQKTYSLLENVKTGNTRKYQSIKTNKIDLENLIRARPLASVLYGRHAELCMRNTDKLATNTDEKIALSGTILDYLSFAIWLLKSNTDPTLIRSRVNLMRFHVLRRDMLLGLGKTAEECYEHKKALLCCKTPEEEKTLNQEYVDLLKLVGNGRFQQQQYQEALACYERANKILTTEELTKKIAAAQEKLKQPEPIAIKPTPTKKIKPIKEKPPLEKAEKLPETIVAEKTPTTLEQKKLTEAKRKERHAAKIAKKKAEKLTKEKPVAIAEVKETNLPEEKSARKALPKPAIQLLRKLQKLSAKKNVETLIVGGASRFMADEEQKEFAGDIDYVTGLTKEDILSIDKEIKATANPKLFKLKKDKLEFDIYLSDHFVRQDITFAERRLADAMSRDFTINALYYSAKKNESVDDPTCRGLNDLKNKIIATINSADEAVNNDPILILRAAHFGAKLSFKIHDDLTAIINKTVQFKERLKAISVAVNTNIAKMIKQKNKIQCIDLLLDSGIFNALFPEFYYAAKTKRDSLYKTTNLTEFYDAMIRAWQAEEKNKNKNWREHIKNPFINAQFPAHTPRLFKTAPEATDNSSPPPTNTGSLCYS